MISNNPIFRNIKEDNNHNILKKDIEKYTLYLFFLMFLSLVFSMTIYKKINNDILVIIGFILSFIISVISFVFSSKFKKKIITSIIFSIFIGLFIGLSSSFLVDYLSVLNYKEEAILNPDSISFKVVSIAFIIPIFSSSIYYYFFSDVRRFYFNYFVIILISLILSITYNYTMSLYTINFNFLLCFVSSTTTVLISSFLQVFYKESIRMILERGIKKEDMILLSLSPLTLIIYFPFEIVYLLFKK